MATFTYFALNGFVLGIWVVHIPTIEKHVGVSPATLGWLLLMLGAGAFAGMRLIGPLTDHWGTRRVVPLSGLLCSVALLGPAFAGNGWILGVSLLGLGFSNGCMDVSMNTHAVQVEARYARPVMSAFHAMYSIGGFAASLVGALTLSQHVDTRLTMSLAAVAAALASVFAAPSLLPHEPIHREAHEKKPKSRTPRAIWIMAAFAVMLMLTEGVANDWSVLSAKDDLHVTASVAALAYGAFAGAMTVGRFCADGVAARFGATAILRYGSMVAAGSLTLIALSPWIALTLAGWTLLGLGLSGTIPQLFSAAGHLDPAAAGVNVSRVVGVGYLGILAGPAVIGPMTRLLSIQHTFVLPLVLCGIVTVFAGVVQGPALNASYEDPRNAVEHGGR
jgi:predicted MFS family arabinose efflux permease